MPKGIFTASAVVLAESAPTLDAIEAALPEVEVKARHGTPSDNVWMGGPSLLVAMRPEVNGFVTIDVVDRPWPDTMGDPTTDIDLFGAWSLGAFGPFVFPGNLTRARAFALRFAEAKRAVEKHGALVRVRASYVLGAPDDAPALPSDYDPLEELRFVTDLARSLLDVPGALAYFDPNGEVLLDAASLARSLEHHRESELPPFDVWSTIRFFPLEEGPEPKWVAMDTIGMEQLDILDQEACFRPDDVDPDDVAELLRNISLYLLERGNVIRDGDTLEGPGGVWRASEAEESLAPAPRPTLRWAREGAGVPPPARH